MKNDYVLAMYDIRGKQEYIFRNNKIREIIGASKIIEDCFRCNLYPAARKYRNLTSGNPEDETDAIYSYHGTEQFDRKKFKQRMEQGNYLGEVIYDGGGNFFILYKNMIVFQEINKIFTRSILEKYDTLKVLPVCREGIDFDNYPEDQKLLYKNHRKLEAHETPSIPAQVLPFTQIDYSTSMPLFEYAWEGEKLEKVSKEAYQKCMKFKKLKKDGRADEMQEYILDNLVTEKGNESLLAIIYIDGNGMGAKVQECLKDSTSYEDCIKKLRELSESIQKNYIDDRKKDIEQMLANKYKNDPLRQKRRIILGAGDEINMICNARDAYDIAITYLKGLPEGFSACAGICIFHSHAPYSDAYRIAEECCESGKKKIKQLMQEKHLVINSDSDFIDFHYCQNGIGTDLEAIRNHESGEIISKPWMVSDKEQDGLVTTAMVKRLECELGKMARSNVKGLAEAAKYSQSRFQTEIKRIQAHSEKEIFMDAGQFQGEKILRSLVYDMVIMYDLWFSSYTQEEIGNEEKNSPDKY